MNLRVACVALAFFATATVDAYAYIDPGTGSVITTAIVGFFAAASYTCRKYIYKVLDILRPRAARDKKGEH
ncbi:hypothetical protein ACG873_09480 [Mesorhizobium sp. AaZ16]|uniref:hypothetical protein n=1 Tax=Mesorhizobium sp. AaZ16 TaxID=3402289 RepID=UPI00374F6922